MYVVEASECAQEILDESSGDGWVQQYQRWLGDAYQKAVAQLDNHTDQQKARHDRYN